MTRSATKRLSPGKGRGHFALPVAALLTFVAGCTLVLLSGRATPARADDSPRFEDQDLAFYVQRDGQWYGVTVDMLVIDDGSPSFAGRVEAARSRVLASFPGAVMPTEGGVTAQYVLAAFTWRTGRASWSYNAAGKPSSLVDDASAVYAAAATWGAMGANFTFTGGGTTTATPGACQDVTDGRNTVGWYPQGGTVLAMTCTYWTLSGAATEFDMQIDPDWNWTTTTSGIRVDLQSVALHEFGHALGLKHPSDRTAVMYATYSSGQNKRIPQTDDLGGLFALYGASASVPSTPTPATTLPTPALNYHVPIAGLARE